MRPRIEFHKILEEILGSKNVYYQPPSSVQMKYPAIVYFRNFIENTHADNSVYKQDNRYRVTYIDKNPISPVVEKLSQLQTCSFETSYVADNLNHTIFNIYF